MLRAPVYLAWTKPSRGRSYCGFYPSRVWVTFLSLPVWKSQAFVEQQWLLQDELKWPRNPLVMHLRTEALVSSASSVQVDERCSCGRCMPVGVACV